MSNILAKVVKKSGFCKMRLAGLLMKKCALFPSKICPVSKDLVTHFQPILKISCFQILAAQLTGL